MSGARQNVCDTRCQAFHADMMKKETTLRIKWFLTNQQRLIENAGKSMPVISTKKSTLQHDQLETQERSVSLE